MKERNKKKIIKTSRILFWIYIILLSYFLFFCERYRRVPVTEKYNLHLFKEIKRYFKYREYIGFEGFMLNIIGNIFAFSPLGFFLPLLNKSYRRFHIVAFLSIFFSLIIETCQLLMKVGVFDVDDILMNSVGCMLGYLAFFILYSIYKKIYRESPEIEREQ